MPFKTGDSNLLHFSDTTKALGAFGAAADGTVLTWDTGTNTWRPEAIPPSGTTIEGTATEGDVAVFTSGAWTSTSKADAGLVTFNADDEITGKTVTRSVGAVSSPETQAVSHDFRTFAGSATINLLETVTTGRTFEYYCTSAGTLTLDPGGTDTINGGGAGAALAIPCSAGQSVRVIRSGAGTWRAVLPLTPNAVKWEISNGVLVAYGGIVLPDGTFREMTSAVPLVAEGTDYSESLSGDTLTVAGPIVGNAGAVQSNSRRYAVALSSLGIVITGASRCCTMAMTTDSIGDNSEARSGTVGLVHWIGSASTTAWVGSGVLRPASGSGTYSSCRFLTTGTSLSAATALASTRGTLAVFEILAASHWDYNFFTIDSSNDQGASTANGTISPASVVAPTHLVVALRADAGASGAVFTDPRGIVTFGPVMGSV